MVPHLALNASSTLSPNLNPDYPPQPTALQFGNLDQNQWGPDAIGTVLFGVIMFIIGITALWQGRPRNMRHEEDEEQGRTSAPVGGRQGDEVAMVDLAEEFGSERVAVGSDEGIREQEMMEDGFVKIERRMRTDTEGTLVGDDDDNGVEVKDVED